MPSENWGSEKLEWKYSCITSRQWGKENTAKIDWHQPGGHLIGCLKLRVVSFMVSRKHTGEIKRTIMTNIECPIINCDC